MTHQAIPEIVTVIGESYCQPIADLLGRLLSRTRVAGDDASAAYYENGYSVSIVILLVALLESYVARLRYLRRAESAVAGKSVPDALLTWFPTLPNHDALREVFLLRNVILHNHIWELDVRLRDEGTVAAMRSPLDLNFQVNQYYDAVVDKSTRRTKLLGLSMNPVGVDRSDIHKVFDVALATLTFLRGEEPNLAFRPDASFGYLGKRTKFADLLAVVKDAL